jgi:tetratricopeptide (TPR) repeat protein
MSQLVRTTDEPAKQVDLLHRIGRVTHRHLDNAEEAEQHFLQALTTDPGHVATMHELVALYSNRGDWLKAAQMMIRAEGATANVLEKVKLLHEAAVIYDQRLGQREAAAEYYAAVLALDPEHVAAGEPLANIYFEQGEYDKLSPILDMLVRKSSGRESAYMLELYYRAARTADELRDFDKALGYYKNAYDIDSTYLPVLVGRADLLFNMQDWDGAGKIYQTILVQHRDSQKESDVVRTYYRLGMVRQNLGERRKALNMFEKALEIDPTHVDTLEAVIGIQEAQGDWEAVIHAKRSLLVTADEDRQIELLDEISGIYANRVDNPQKAIGALREALEVKPDHHQLLQKLLDLYTSTEQWKKSVETIERFIELEADHLRRGMYHNAAGDICRGKMKAIDEAIDYYERALDCFFEEGTEKIPQSFLPRTYKPFEYIDKLYTTKRDWKGQERTYRRMIKRLSQGDQILVNLWHNLGEIYRSRLKQFGSAVAAFEVAQRLDPKNVQRREILAELYVLAGPEHSDKAVLQHMLMLKDEPFRTESYKQLRKIYMDTRQYDKAWCVCATLAFLKKADPEEVQFYEQYKPRGFVKAKHRLTETHWSQLLHDDEDRYVSAIFGAIWQGAASIHSMPHKNFGLKRKDRRVIETDDLNFSRIFYYTSQVLNVPLPEVYLQPEQQGDILIANVHDRGQLVPSFVVRAGLLSGRPEKEIAFSSAQWMSYMRPDHFLKLALQTNTDLKRAFLSAIVLVKRDFPIAPDMQPLVAQYLPEMQRRTTPQMLEQLGLVVHRFLQAAPEVNLKTWGNAVEASSFRAGFVVCGDLEVAARMISLQPTVVGGATPKERVKELVLFSVSEDYFAVRAALGLQIG